VEARLQQINSLLKNIKGLQKVRKIKEGKDLVKGKPFKWRYPNKIRTLKLKITKRRLYYTNKRMQRAKEMRKVS